MLYLRLSHGRSRPDERLDDWGRDGPCLGPFRWIHLTYLSDVHGEDDAGEACEFEIVGGLVFYDGWFYGDVTIEVALDVDSTPERFDGVRARRRGDASATARR